MKKIIINGIPSKSNHFMPYIQIFKAGKIIHNTLKDNLKAYTKKDVSMCFDLCLEISGDIILRCREYSEAAKETVFRVMFHTAFTDDFTLRFYRNDIDGGNKDCFPEDFMVDIFFTSHLGETNVVPKNVKMAALKKKSKEINEYLNVEEEEEEART